MAVLLWAARGSSSAAPPQKAAPKAAVKAPAKAAARNQYKRSTSIRRTYGTGNATKGKRVATQWRAKTPAPRRVFYNPGQPAPAVDRYTDIEKALSDRGYLSKDPDGKWDQRSAEALKKFQADQNLRSDGKLSSMSLIALGLGPKRISPDAIAPVVPAAARPTVVNAPPADPGVPVPDTGKASK